jgi:hypothetical protein
MNHTTNAASAGIKGKGTNKKNAKTSKTAAAPTTSQSVTKSSVQSMLETLKIAESVVQEGEVKGEHIDLSALLSQPQHQRPKTSQVLLLFIRAGCQTV